ncbi:Flagellar protein (FlbD) [Planctomycetes bacterium Pan216]|uniref:Flagellar protein (FlbD) n=1 Tax=Kolteria novifilia TaxID=2527975 RepID=A0A518B9V5_9BACT|nr:Flagellar protein (FlbD) [Planctomycetes bacterium Pan216]
MIKLTRLNGQAFVLNSELIKFIEKTPDTLLTLRDGDKVMVREEPEEVVRRVVEYVRSLQYVPHPKRGHN